VGARPADWDRELGYIGGLAPSEKKEAGRARRRAVQPVGGPRGQGWAKRAGHGQILGWAEMRGGFPFYVF
jgi:hypothetical protein